MRLLCLVLLLSGSLWSTADANAVVRRCLSSEGVTIFTDRPCTHFDAKEVASPVSKDETPTEASAPPSGEPEQQPLSSYGPAHTDCARTSSALLEQLRHLLNKKDINGLAGLYHWPGMGKYSARAIMDRLETLATQASSALTPVYPEAAFVVFQPEAYPGMPPEDPEGVLLFLPSHPATPASIEQTVPLRFLQYAGCWWLHF